jgi:hypothetical protein
MWKAFDPLPVLGVGTFTRRRMRLAARANHEEEAREDKEASRILDKADDEGGARDGT